MEKEEEEWGTENRVRRSKNEEPGTKNPERRTGNREPKLGNEFTAVIRMRSQNG